MAINPARNRIRVPSPALGDPTAGQAVARGLQDVARGVISIEQAAERSTRQKSLLAARTQAQNAFIEVELEAQTTPLSLEDSRAFLDDRIGKIRSTAMEGAGRDEELSELIGLQVDQAGLSTRKSVLRGALGREIATGRAQTIDALNSLAVDMGRPGVTPGERQASSVQAEFLLDGAVAAGWWDEGSKGTIEDKFLQQADEAWAQELINTDPQNAAEQINNADIMPYLGEVKREILVRQATAVAARRDAENVRALQKGMADYLTSIRKFGTDQPGGLADPDAAIDIAPTPIDVADDSNAFTADEMARIRRQEDISFEAHAVQQGLEFSNPQEMREMLDSFRPEPGELELGFHVAVFNELESYAATIQQRKAADPSGYAQALQSGLSPGVPGARNTLRGQKGRGDIPKTPEAATRENLEIQESVGVLERDQRIFSNAQAASIAESYTAAETGTEKLEILTDLITTYGVYGDRALDEMLRTEDGLPPTAVLMMDDITPAMRSDLVAIENIPPEDLQKLLESGNAKKLMEDVRVNFEDEFAKTIPPGANPTRHRIAFLEAAQQVAVFRKTQGDPDPETSTMDGLFNDRYAYVGGGFLSGGNTIRVPNGINARAVEAITDRTLDRLVDDVEGLDLGGIPSRFFSEGLDDEGVWYTNQDEDGVTLYYLGGPVVDTLGNPISLSFMEMETEFDSLQLLEDKDIKRAIEIIEGEIGAPSDEEETEKERAIKSLTGD